MNEDEETKKGERIYDKEKRDWQREHWKKEERTYSLVKSTPSSCGVELS